jgi:hypothetical protein
MYWGKATPFLNLEHCTRNNRTHKSKKGKVVPVLNLIKHYAMKAYEGVDV